MFNAFERLRVAGIILTAVVIVIGVFFNVFVRLQVKDIQVLSSARSFSYGLERYRDLRGEYPIGAPKDLRKAFTLSENGFANGTTVLFSGDIPGSGAVTYTNATSTYTISFKIRFAWPEQGLKGRHCIVSEGYQLVCR